MSEDNIEVTPEEAVTTEDAVTPEVTEEKGPDEAAPETLRVGG